MKDFAFLIVCLDCGFVRFLENQSNKQKSVYSKFSIIRQDKDSYESIITFFLNFLTISNKGMSIFFLLITFPKVCQLPQNNLNKQSRKQVKKSIFIFLKILLQKRIAITAKITDTDFSNRLWLKAWSFSCYYSHSAIEAFFTRKSALIFWQIHHFFRHSAMLSIPFLLYFSSTVFLKTRLKIPSVNQYVLQTF